MHIKGSFLTDDVRLDLGDGLKLPTKITASAKYEHAGYKVLIVAEYDQDAGRYIARSVYVDGWHTDEVTGEVLRAVPVAMILREGVRSALQSVLLLSGERPPDDIGKKGPTTETLRWVARIYRLAVLLGDAPTQAVAAGLDIPRSTAGRWVTRARDRGLLTVVDPRASRTE